MGGGGLFVDLSKVGEMCLKVNGKERNATTSSNPRHHVIHIVRQAPHKKKYRKRERKHLKIGNPVGSHSSTVPFKMNRNVYLEKQETVHSASPDRPERVDRPWETKCISTQYGIDLIYLFTRGFVQTLSAAVGCRSLQMFNKIMRAIREMWRLIEFTWERRSGRTVLERDPGVPMCEERSPRCPSKCRSSRFCTRISITKAVHFIPINKWTRRISFNARNKTRSFQLFRCYGSKCACASWHTQLKKLQTTEKRH